jgi:hypothetical protein
VTIDSARQDGRPRHRRITYLTGSSTSDKILRQVRRRARGKSTVLVVLDSGHGKDHGRSELHAYTPLVTPGSYLLSRTRMSTVTPWKATMVRDRQKLLRHSWRGNDAFVRDESREWLMLRFNPGGYLKKRETAIGDAPSSSSRRGRLWRRLQIRWLAHRSAKIGHAAKLVGPPGCVANGEPDQYVL